MHELDQETGLTAEVLAWAEASRQEATIGPALWGLLERVPDARVLRDALADAGYTDPTGHLVRDVLDRAELVISERMSGSPPAAESLGPLFAERPEVVLEHLGDVRMTVYLLRVVDHFPALPDLLVPRLAELTRSDVRPVRRTAARILGRAGRPVVGQEGEEAADEPAPPGVERVLDRFRELAYGRGIPTADVERWLPLIRPCAVLGTGFDGPVVGRLGGPLLLPPDAPDLDWWDHLVATLDCAALPPDATDLPLPRDGHLLLLAYPGGDDHEGIGKVIHVPAGAPVEERVVDHGYSPDDHLAGLDAELAREGELRLGYHFSLPGHADTVDDAEHPFAEELRRVWDHDDFRSWPDLQVGGHASDEYGDEDPVLASGRRAARRGDATDPAPEGTSPASVGPETGSETGPETGSEIRPEDWVLLAQWSAGVRGLEGMRVFWSVARQDLAARRFDRADASLFWNP